MIHVSTFLFCMYHLIQLTQFSTVAPAAPIACCSLLAVCYYSIGKLTILMKSWITGTEAIMDHQKYGSFLLRWSIIESEHLWYVFHIDKYIDPSWGFSKRHTLSLMPPQLTILYCDNIDFPLKNCCNFTL